MMLDEQSVLPIVKQELKKDSIIRVWLPLCEILLPTSHHTDRFVVYLACTQGFLKVHSEHKEEPSMST